jgi:calcineurin-like phosphoesterase family protein
MRKIWIISDTHFGHKNILNFQNEGKYVREGFSSVEDMNEQMIENWNNKVSSNDIIYHLGDVYFNSKKEAEEIISRLNGHKRLILGNHDNPKDYPISNNFKKIMLWRHFTISDVKVVLSHMPIHDTGFGRYELNIHGHIHDNDSPSDKHVNVSVEKINYEPVLLTDIVNDWKQNVS